jgi:hypothetical protein
VSTLSHNAGCYTSEKWLPDRLENYRYSTNYLKCILYSLLEVIEVTEFCSINSKLQFPSPPPKGFKSGQRAGHAVGPPRLSHCSGNTLLKKFGNEWRKCGGSPQRMTQKWIILCRSTSCNRSGRTFRRKSR